MRICNANTAGLGDCCGEANGRHSVRSFTTMTIAERVALHHGKPDQTMQEMIDEVNLARAHARSMHVFYVIESKQTGSTQVACI